MIDCRTPLLLSLLLISALLLTSCGYHLQGSGGDQGRLFSAQLKKISVEGLGHYESLRRDLVSALRSYGFRVTKSHTASARLIMLNKEERTVVGAIGNNAKVREYLLYIKIHFRVETGGEKKKVLLQEQIIQVEAPYLNNPDNFLVTQKLKEDARAYSEEQLIQRIINRLATIK